MNKFCDYKKEAIINKQIQFQPKAHHTLQGRRVSISEAIQIFIEDFLSTPLTERLENLSGTLKSIDGELAGNIINSSELTKRR